MKGPPLGPGGEDITWPDQVAPRGRKASSTRKIKPQTSNLRTSAWLYRTGDIKLLQQKEIVHGSKKQINVVCFYKTQVRNVWYEENTSHGFKRHNPLHGFTKRKENNLLRETKTLHGL